MEVESRRVKSCEFGEDHRDGRLSINIIFHYPPELLNLLVDTIPLLCRSKKDVFLFFKGAGVKDSLMSAPINQWNQDKASISKFEIVRQTLTALNEKGEASLRERREVLKRVVEFENFSACWDSDQLKAKGLVGEIRQLVNVKDSFTRMNIERERERQHRIEKENVEREANRLRNENIDTVRKDLFSLFSMVDPHKRGKLLEEILNRLFKVYKIGIREAFALVDEAGSGITEQIDGVIEVGGFLYFVEMKWWNQPLGVPEVSQHLVRIYHRAEARAIIISASDFTEPAIVTCKQALQQKVVILCTLQELVLLLERRGNLSDFVKSKAHAAQIDHNPFVKVLN